MSAIRPKFRVLSSDETYGSAVNQTQVGYVEGAVGGPDRVASLAALFPQVNFVSVGAEWPDRAPGLACLIVGADAAEADRVVARFERAPPGPPIIVALRNADVASTRRIMRAGAADILPAPVGDAALALSLERLLATAEQAGSRAVPGQVIAIVKAGGGTGATALGTQLATLLAGRGDIEGGVCFVDLDLQFGLGALYLDLADAMSITDVLSGGSGLDDIPLATAIARHRSGARLLAAPRELTALELLAPADIDGLFKALRRDFAVSLLDLPPAWTAWTNQALQQCDRIVMVTNLSVPHINLVQRQLMVLAIQRLDAIPLTLVCNQLSQDQKGVVSLKAAEKALHRSFDVVIPEDRRLMNDAIAQGCELSAIRGGSKLEKAIRELAGVLAPVAAQGDRRSRRWP